MLIQNLITEFELRNNITNYKKLYRNYLYTKIEKNNYNRLRFLFEDLFIKKL